MIKKLQGFLNIVLVLFVVVAIIYFVIASITNLFKKDIFIRKNELKNYVVEDKLVTTYSIFNNLEQCVSNLHEAMINQEYDGIYYIIGKNTKNTFSKEQIMNKLKEYRATYFGTMVNDEVVQLSLKKAYTTEAGYLIELTCNVSSEPLYMVVNIDFSEKTYTIDLVL